jgi:hypothetical protein
MTVQSHNPACPFYEGYKCECEVTYPYEEACGIWTWKDLVVAGSVVLAFILVFVGTLWMMFR